MAKHLKLAERGAPLPLAAATETWAILGRRGSGKTHTATVLAEELHAAGVQIVVMDPLDVWWGLRVSKDGRSGGLPIYVAGGTHQDIPLTADAGRVLADTVVTHRLSIVLSTRHLSKTDQRRFAADFFERLYDRKAEPDYRTAVVVLVDEADEFVPQRLVPGSERCFGAVDRAVRRGRSSGIATVLISQRPQVINKDVLSQTEILIAHQLTGPQDRKALEAWIEANDDANRGPEFMGSLASLAKGEAWIWSPGLLRVFARVQVRDRHTYDSSSTPKPGAAAAAPKAFAPVDLETLKQDIAATIEQAKADDPRELRKRLAAAERENAELRKSASREKTVPIQPQQVEILTDGDRALLERLTGKFDEHNRAVREQLDRLLLEMETRARSAFEQSAGQVRVSFQSSQEHIAKELAEVGLQRVIHGYELLKRLTPNVSAKGTDSHLPPGEQAILKAAAMWPEQGVSRDQLGVLTGYKRSSRDTYVARLLAKGLVAINHQAQVYATEQGIAALGSDFEPLPTGRDLYTWWMSRLPAGEAKVLDVLVRADGRPVDRETIDIETGFKRSSRDTYLSRLAARRLIESVGRGQVRASGALL